MQDSKLLVAGTISGTNNAITGFSLASAVAGTAVYSPYSVDLNPGRQSGIDIGEGTPVYLKWVITTTITGATGLTIGIVSDSTAALNTTPVTLASTSASALTAGTYGYLQVPPVIGGSTAALAGLGQEFLGATFTPTGANVTAGAIVAEFTTEIADSRSFYPAGFSVI